MTSNSQSHPTYPTRLRQIALLTPTASFAQARHLLTTIFASPVIFVDPAVGQWGLQNFLIPLGGDILEVVSPLPSHPGTATTAGRLLAKRASDGTRRDDTGAGGEGGYMIIMQTIDASARRTDIEAGRYTEARKVIFSHPFSNTYSSIPEWEEQKDEGHCIQYHPKGIKGGMMPELDSHTPCKANPQPLDSRFSPWHACGKDYPEYVRGMKQTGHLQILDVVLRLAEGDKDVVGAAEQWSKSFGVENFGEELAYTNCRMRFVEGSEGQKEGLVSVTVGVSDKKQLIGIEERAKKEGMWKTRTAAERSGWIDMVGVRWYLSLIADEAEQLRAKI